MIAPTPRSLTPSLMLTQVYSLTFCREGPEFALQKGIIDRFIAYVVSRRAGICHFNGLFIRYSI
jgi:hypothetical protein